MIGVNVATVLILYNGGNMVLRGELEVGQLSSIITYIFNILFSVMMVGMALLQLTRARACADRIFEVLDTEPSIEDGKSAAEPADVKGLVEFRNVSSSIRPPAPATTSSGTSALPQSRARPWPLWAAPAWARARWST